MLVALLIGASVFTEFLYYSGAPVPVCWMIAPPVGVNLFVVRSIALAQIIRGVGPFIVANIFRIVIIAAFPALTVFLPNLLF